MICWHQAHYILGIWYLMKSVPTCTGYTKNAILLLILYIRLKRTSICSGTQHTQAKYWYKSVNICIPQNLIQQDINIWSTKVHQANVTTFYKHFRESSLLFLLWMTHFRFSFTAATTQLNDLILLKTDYMQWKMGITVQHINNWITSFEINIYHSNKMFNVLLNMQWQNLLPKKAR